MSEVKSRILIFSAALLLILSALAPMLLVFGTGGTALAAPGACRCGGYARTAARHIGVGTGDARAVDRHGQ